jgi:hypothetical protein
MPKLQNTPTDLKIDSRGFHTFQFRGDRLLFDRATGSTLQLNDLTFDILQEVERVGVAEVLRSVPDRYPGMESQR